MIVALRDRLRVKLGELGLNTSDADLYTFYDDADIEVGADEMFDVSGGALDFVARAMLDGGCEEEYKFNVKVVLEGNAVGKRVEYNAQHTRDDGKIEVFVTEAKNAMVKVYIDNEVVSEMTLK